MSAVSSSPPPQAVAAATGNVGGSSSTLIYHQTIVPTQNVTHALEGSFTLPNASDLVLVRHNVLELWTLHTSTNTLECIHATPLFAAVYAAVAVPTSRASSTLLQHHHQSQHSATPATAARGGSVRRDGVHYVALTSETGYVTLLRYALCEPPIPTRVALADGNGDDDAEGSRLHNTSTTAATEAGAATTMLVTTSLRGCFVKVSEVCLGRSGARLTVPGARMAVDVAGEALFIAALMRNKVVVPLLRNNNNSSHADGSSDGSGSGYVDDDVGNDGGRVAREAMAGASYLGKSNHDDIDDSNNNNAGTDDGDEGGDDRDDAPSRSGGAGSGATSGTAAALLLRRRIAQQRQRRGVLRLGSPLEVVRQTVTYAVCALDNVVDNTAFAALEEDVVEAAEDSHDGDNNNNNNANGDERVASSSSSMSSRDGHGAYLKLPASHAQQQQQQTQRPRRRYLVVYAYVPSLQQVQRTHLMHVHATAHRLVAVPGAPYGPGGVLVCTDVDVTWYSLSSTTTTAVVNNSNSMMVAGSASSSQQQPASSDVTLTSVFRCSAALPRRLHYTQTLYDPSIVQHAVTCVARDFFMLLQNEEGDVFRVVLPQAAVQRAYDALRAQQQLQQQPQSQQRAPAVPNPLSVLYFDTLPVASAMALFRRGCLFVAAEAGAQHGLYKITRNGYSKESDYIVRRIKRSTRTAPTTTTTTGASSRDCDSKKRARSSGDDDDAQMPAPAPRLPTRTGATTATTTGSHATTVVRVVALYQAHTQLMHMALLRTYPNTPAITSLTTSIQGNTTTTTGGGGGFADASQPPPQQQQQQQQQHLCISAVAGRGVDSVLLLARYGYATRREAHYTLPTAFTAVLPLASATALQWLLREQQNAIAAAAATSSSHSATGALLHNRHATHRRAHHASAHEDAAAAATRRLRALRRLAASVSGGGGGGGGGDVWHDKLLLCTGHGTSVYTVGATLETDTLSGFVANEHTLAACTLRYGSGYVQVTTRGIYVLRATTLLHTSSRRGGGGMAGDHDSNNNNSNSHRHAHASMQDSVAAEPVSWTHPHGKPILAAAATPTLVLVSFGQGGGLACFDFGHSGTRLQQRDVAPTFATAPALSLLQPPASSLLHTGAVQSELSALLFATTASHNHHNSNDASSPVQLAAVATMAREVHLLEPSRLRQPLTTIARHASSSSPITSVLLTYLGTGEDDALPDNNNNVSNNNVSSSSSARRLFCFIGHLDGTLACCELDTATAHVVDTTELTCGNSPCQLIAGDGERVCYVLCGSNAWRCDVYNGVVKVVPWRFPQRQTAFARFVAPTSAQLRRLRRRGHRGKSTTRSSGNTNSTAVAHDATAVKHEVDDDDDNADDKHDNDDDDDDDEDDDDMRVLTLRGGGAAGQQQQQRAEQVIALHERTLSLFSASQGRAGGATTSSLEYSFSHHALPVAGRRVLRHPTRPSYLILAGAMHRGHPFAVTAAAAAAAAAAQQQHHHHHAVAVKTEGGDDSKTTSAAAAAAVVDARSLGKADVYASTLQLYHEDTQRLYPAYHFPDGEAVTSIAVGSFYADFGKEPVVVVATASAFTHGAHCGRAATCTQGWMRTFRCVTASAMGGAGGGGGTGAAAALYNSDGSAVLRLEPLHNTLLRSDSTAAAAAAASSSSSPDFASALHICEDVGLLFVGLGATNGLRVYGWGTQHLLRKRHLPNAPSRIIAIATVFVTPPSSATTTTTSSSSSSSASSSSCYLPDLYRCPLHKPDAVRRARERQLLVVCATVAHSVFVASLQPGGRDTPSYLLRIAQDAIPRALTCMAVVDERTYAVADRSGLVSFLRLPAHTRFGFAQPVEQMYDAEIAAAQAYMDTQQTLTQVACHATGQLVTSLQVQAHDAGDGRDAALAIRAVVYGTALGAVGVYVPFVSDEDAVLAAYVQPLLTSRARLLLLAEEGSLPYHLQNGCGVVVTTPAAPTHNVIEGNLLQLYRQAGTTVFTTEAKMAIEADLERVRRMDAARRRVLGLPPRDLPSVAELLAKQRALITLPQ